MTVLRLLVAALAPLSPDEAYYWVWSRALAPGYLDHPPMVALFIRMGTVLGGDGALGVRLLSPFAVLAGTWLLAQAAEDFWPGQGTGTRAAVMLNATLLLGVGSVTATPDTPLLLFWVATLAAIGRLVATGDGRWWCAVGVAGGLALDSKYTAILLAPAVLIWMLVVPAARRWFATVWPYLAAALALALFAPVLWWNAAHGWASFARQGGRLADFSADTALGYLAELFGGQIGLATPGLMVAFAAGIFAALRRNDRLLLAAASLVPLAVFVQHALGDRVQANWPAVMFPSAAIAAGGLGLAWRRWMTGSVWLGVALTALIWLQAVSFALPVPGWLDPVALQLGGWPGLAAQVAEIAAAEHAAYVAIDNYGLASRMARELPASLPVVGVQSRWALFSLPSGTSTLAAGPGLVLRSARRTDTPDPADWSQVRQLGLLSRVVGAMPVETYEIYRAIARPGGSASAVLPRPEMLPAGVSDASANP